MNADVGTAAMPVATARSCRVALVALAAAMAGTLRRGTDKTFFYM